VGIVHRELVATIGEGVSDINLAAQPPAVILMAGLQGAGKTTTDRQAGQAPDRKAQEEGADGVRRRLPAGRHRAAEDGDAAGGRRVVPETPDQKPVDIARAALDYARKQYFDVLLVDTGRPASRSTRR
jgi:signal recognition particle subunit SRP54